MNDYKLEEKKMRMEAQLDLIKANLQTRHQTVINLAITSIAIIALSALIKNDLYLKIGITFLFALNLVGFWYDVIVVRKAIKKSTEKLDEILGKSFDEEVYKTMRKPGWIIQYFAEVMVGIFSFIVIYFIILLFRE